MADVSTQLQTGSTGSEKDRMRRTGLSGWLARRLLACLRVGSLTIVLPNGGRIERRTGCTGPEAVLAVHRYRAFRCLIFGGDVGFAEAYIRGDWSSPDLVALIELAARNGDAIERQISGWLPSRGFNRLRHRAHANTKAGSRRNVEFHYDLGNAFYRHWLCRDMIYSSAIYETPADSLDQAQARKLEAIMASLDVAPGMDVLEIGCGWGTLAARLGQRGASVLGVTLSPAQLSYAEAVIAEAGLGEKVALRLQDYRDLDAHFDRIVSIEMIEAVGEQFLPGYFDMLSRRLKPGGRVVIQVITIAEERFESYRSRPDFIQRYIFPGGFLPTKTLMREGLAAAGLRLVSQANFGLSYARTLAEWRRRFETAWHDIAKLGYTEEFKRLWIYYLSYCEAGFTAGALDVGLYTIEHRR